MRKSCHRTEKVEALAQAHEVVSQVGSSGQDHRASRGDLSRKVDSAEEPPGNSADGSTLPLHYSLSNKKADTSAQLHREEHRRSETQDEFSAYEPKSGVTVSEGVFRKLLCQCTWGKRVRFGFSVCCARSLDSAGRTRLTIRNSRQISGRKRFQASLVDCSECNICAVRLVWDAIT